MSKSDSKNGMGKMINGNNSQVHPYTPEGLDWMNSPRSSQVPGSKSTDITNSEGTMKDSSRIGSGDKPEGQGLKAKSIQGCENELTSSTLTESVEVVRRWCFCCLQVKGSSAHQDRSKELRLGNVPEKEEPATLEELKSWGESFDKLMKAAGGRRLFREFLRSEYSEENMLFYLACEDLKKEENPELVEEKARLIYEDFISILSPREVSLDSRVREQVNRNMTQPDTHTFDEAQLQIFTLMHRDSYPRFLNSQIYKKQLQQLQNT